MKFTNAVVNTNHLESIIIIYLFHLLVCLLQGTKWFCHMSHLINSPYRAVTCDIIMTYYNNVLRSLVDPSTYPAHSNFFCMDVGSLQKPVKFTMCYSVCVCGWGGRWVYNISHCTPPLNPCPSPPPHSLHTIALEFVALLREFRWK